MPRMKSSEIPSTAFTVISASSGPVGISALKSLLIVFVQPPKRVAARAAAIRRAAIRLIFMLFCFSSFYRLTGKRFFRFPESRAGRGFQCQKLYGIVLI